MYILKTKTKKIKTKNNTKQNTHKHKATTTHTHKTLPNHAILCRDFMHFNLVQCWDGRGVVVR